MNKIVHWTRLVREIVLLVTAVLKAVEVAIEIVNKAVNCSRANQLQIHLPTKGQAYLCAK